MGTIIGRTRKDGSKALTAQIVIKKGGVIVHREAETFDRKQAANVWIVKREGELSRAAICAWRASVTRKPNPRVGGRRSLLCHRYGNERATTISAFQFS
jgi:hypothetical protein